MKRYSKKVREEAALICAIAASTPTEWYSTIEIGLGLCDGCRDDSSHDLAVAAYRYVERYSAWPQFGQEVDAEAEALIRTGWIPS
jgi:hypothetical protein